MKAFKPFSSVVAPLDRSNIDTDAILPKQYLKSIERNGFGITLFDDWRYLDPGILDGDHATRRKNPDFILNHPSYCASSILLSRKNFGCGSSREHAVWALLEYGFKVIIAESFAEIFSLNADKNGLLLITLPEREIEILCEQALSDARLELNVDLEKQQLKDPLGGEYTFSIDAARKNRFLLGLDDIAIILQHADKISIYEKERCETHPWLFIQHDFND